MKDVLMQVASDTGAKSAVTRMVHELLSWYKEKGNMKKASYYRDLEEQ
jgi:FMN-dependent NADH-azoreductase